MSVPGERASETSDTPNPHGGQLGYARRFADDYSQRLMYAHGLGWHEWDRNRWALCEDGAPVRYAADLLARAGSEIGNDKDKFRELRKVETSSGVSGILSLAGSLYPLAVAGRLLDRDPYLFNTVGGTVELRSGTARPANPMDRITRIAGASLDLSARSGEFDDFLARILPDVEKRAFVQRLLGYAMLGVVREHIMPIWTGTGSNGKGTLRDAVLAAFGEYARELDPDILMHRSGEVHSTERTDLLGLRLAFISETEKGRPFSEAIMKRLVGGENITARRMRENTITFEPSHTLVMLTNHLPPASSDPAVWRRIRVVHFGVVIPDDEVDGELPERLKSAVVRPAVLAWIYRGYQAYRQLGLAAPAAVRDATAEYRQNSDVVGLFLAERCRRAAPGTEDLDVTTGARELYDAWRTWCVDTGEESGTETEFATAILGREVKRKRSSRGWRYRGLELLNEHGEGQGV